MNISFSMTTKQVEESFATGDVQKDVTRRNGWRKLKPGPYGQEEVRREGFKQWSPRIFVDFFLRGHKGVTLYTDITRIEFEYLPRRNDLGEKTVLNINPVGAE